MREPISRDAAIRRIAGMSRPEWVLKTPGSPKASASGEAVVSVARARMPAGAISPSGPPSLTTSLRAREHASETASAFVPLSFAPGEAYQFDWSHEIVLINGMTMTVKVAHLRLCHSRMFVARAYPRETQERVFDAHERACAFFKYGDPRSISATLTHKF